MSRKDISPQHLGTRRRREYETVFTMITIYCCDHHHTTTVLCTDCEELRCYTLRRLERCLFEEGKSVCLNCTICCYSKTMRERIREVMRYAGPRMPSKHPWLAFRHWLDAKRRAPTLQEAVNYHRRLKD
ncbi:MAG: nitrous oxide-stimulated promoter family protein [Burkholderiales bacterium]|jgi:hypothetical protein|nr:nitrous oxide-stimulated promoter family protein [Burkholderiales bacterium]